MLHYEKLASKSLQIEQTFAEHASHISQPPLQYRTTNSFYRGNKIQSGLISRKSKGKERELREQRDQIEREEKEENQKASKRR